MNANAAKPEKSFIDVIVTTDKDRRGVFFGRLSILPTEIPNTLTLVDARMVIYWPSGGVVGLAAEGPPDKTRVSAACAAMALNGITSIQVCTTRASERWAAWTS